MTNQFTSLTSRSAAAEAATNTCNNTSTQQLPTNAECFYYYYLPRVAREIIDHQMSLKSLPRTWPKVNSFGQVTMFVEIYF
jgi:hypothetical protein